MEDDRIVSDQHLEEETEPLDPLKDGKRKWRCLGADCPDSCCGFMFQEAKISVSEIPHLSRYFPLSFNILTHPGGETDISLSIFLRAPLGRSPCAYLRQGEGCALGEDRPTVCKQRPFCMAKGPDGSYRAALKPSCPGFSLEAGHTILMPDGGINPIIDEGCIKPAMRSAESAEETQRFVDMVQSHNLIAVGCCEHRGQKIYMHVIDAKKFCSLPMDVRDSFRENGYIDLILAHINSVAHYRRFIDIYLDSKKERTEPS